MTHQVLQQDADIADPCPTCRASEGEYCRNRITGKPAHICCVARLKRAMA